MNGTICPKCHKNANPDFKFCPECGNRLIRKEVSAFSNFEWYTASDNNMAEFEALYGRITNKEPKDLLLFLKEKHKAESRYGIVAKFKDWKASEAYYGRARRNPMRDRIEQEWVSPAMLLDMLSRQKYDKSGHVFYSDVSWEIQMKFIAKADLANIDTRFFKTEQEVREAINAIGIETI